MQITIKEPSKIESAMLQFLIIEPEYGVVLLS